MRRWTDFFILIAVLAAMIVLFGLMRDSFFSIGTLGTVANRIPALALVATGMTLVMVTTQFTAVRWYVSATAWLSRPIQRHPPIAQTLGQLYVSGHIPEGPRFATTVGQKWDVE